MYALLVPLFTSGLYKSSTLLTDYKTRIDGIQIVSVISASRLTDQQEEN